MGGVTIAPMKLLPAAIVTGASRGIGKAIALALGAQGWAVVVNYRASEQAAHDVAHQIEEQGGRALASQADVGDLGQHAALLENAADHFGPVGLLVNNAAVPCRQRVDLLETDTEDYDRVLSTNLRGPFFLTQRIAAHMLEHRDSLRDAPPRMIINIGSVSAYAATPERGQYCIAKAGLAMMTSLFASRLARDGILVYEIRPGVIDTDMVAAAKSRYEERIGEQDLLPIPRMGTPDDVAQAVAMLAAGALPYSTGAVIDVDGGFHLRRL